MSAETVAAVVGNAALALSLVVALAFGLQQARSNNRDRRERLAIDTIREMQTREMAAHFQRLGHTDMPQTVAAFDQLPAQEQVNIIHFAQQMEMLGLMVFDGMIDLSLVERTMGDYVAISWEKYRPFTYDRREIDPYMNEYFEWLAHCLDEQMRDHPRPPAYTTVAGRS
jgi:hypothetical protein